LVGARDRFGAKKERKAMKMARPSEERGGSGKKRGGTWRGGKMNNSLIYTMK